MKWRNTKERELLTSSNSINNTNQFTDDINLPSTTSNSTSTEKNEISVLSNDCCDCQHEEKEEIITFRSPSTVSNDQTNDSNIDENNDSRRE